MCDRVLKDMTVVLALVAGVLAAIDLAFVLADPATLVAGLREWFHIG